MKTVGRLLCGFFLGYLLVSGGMPPKTWRFWAIVVLTAVSTAFLSGCVSARYAQLQRDEAKQSCEDALTACQNNWENEMKASDALRQDVRDGKYGRKVEPEYGVEWK